MNTELPFNQVQRRFLRKTRGSWFFSMLSQLPLPFILLPLTGTQWIEEQPDAAARQAMFLSLLIGAVAVVAGFFRRNQVYKANWRGDVIQPGGYYRANNQFFLCLSYGALMIALISGLSRYPAPTLAAAPIFAALMVFSFPSGRPMLPAPPRIDNDGGLR